LGFRKIGGEAHEVISKCYTASMLTSLPKAFCEIILNVRED
jgi:hypothetical protein